MAGWHLLTRLQANWRRYLRRRDHGRPASLAALRAWAVPDRVSIVLPTYNGRRHLDEAIESIRAQTWPHWELILVDDGSTDGTGDLADQWARADPRIRVIHQANQRLPGALNTGFRAARGEFHTWTSDDNRLRPGFLAALVAVLRERPAADAVYTDYDLIDEAGRPLLDSPVCRALQSPPGAARLRLPRQPFDLNFVNGNYLGGAFLYRAHATRLLWGREWDGPYSPNRFLCEDYDFFLRLNAWLRLEHSGLEQSLYEYRLHSDSLTATARQGRVRELSEELLRFDDFRRDMTLWPILWHIESVDDPTRLGSRLRLRALDVGDHVTAEREAPPWLAAVWVRVDNSETQPGCDVPAGWARVLVCRRPPRGDLSDWDVILTEAKPGDDPPPGAPILRYRDEEALWHALRVAAWQRQAVAAEARAFDETPPRHRLSVVVGTNRPSLRLRPLIDSLADQTAPKSIWELLLVDNARGRHPRELTSGLPRLAELPHVRSLSNPVPGLSITRNAGLAEARGAIVLFLDDDVTLAPTALAALLAAWAAVPDAGVMGGAIELAPLDRPPRWLGPAVLKYWGGLAAGLPARHAAATWRELPFGGFWSARAALLRRIGGFRGRYGRAGLATDAGEEIVAALQLRADGRASWLEPAARALHHVSRDRITLPAFFRIRKTNADTFFLLSSEGRIDDDPGLSASLRSGLRQILRALAPVPRPLDVRLDHLGNAVEHLWLAHRLFYYRLGRLRPGSPPAAPRQ